MKNIFYITLALATICLNPVFAQNFAMLGTSHVSDNVTLSVTIPKISRIELCESKNVIEVSDSDVARGYAALPKAMSFKVWCNSGGGTLVGTELNGGIFNQDGREFPGEMLMFQMSGQRDFQPYSSQSQTLYQSDNIQRGELLAVDLRLRLSKEMTPGRYYFQAMFTLVPI